MQGKGVGNVADEPVVDELIAVLQVLRQLTNPVRRGEITAQQYWLLRLLYCDGPKRVTEVATELGIGQSAATTACQRLERQGLLTRTRLADDERVVLVALTDAGQGQIDTWLAARRRLIGDVLEPLAASERQQLALLLVKLRRSAEGMRRRSD